MDLVLIDLLKIAVVCRPEDWIRDIPPGDLCYSLRDSLFDSDGREAEDVLKILLVLRVAVCVDFRFDGAVFDAVLFGG